MFVKRSKSPPTTHRQLTDDPSSTTLSNINSSYAVSRSLSGHHSPSPSHTPTSSWTTSRWTLALQRRRRLFTLVILFLIACAFFLFFATFSSESSLANRGLFASPGFGQAGDYMVDKDARSSKLALGSDAMMASINKRQGYPSRSDRIYSDDGMFIMEMPSSGQSKSHPFYELIQLAETKWNDMLSSQSKTLSQAVKEYKRRYGMDPPRGFDDWFNFCQNHGIKIVDEYDQMMRDVLVHYALKPSEFIKRMVDLRGSDFTFTLDVTPQRVEITGPRAEKPRPKQFERLFDSFKAQLPSDFSLVLTFSDHDTGSQVLGDDQRQRAMELVQTGDYFEDDELISYENPRRTPAWGWFKACLLDSPANERPKAELKPDLHNYQGPKSFIFDHLPTMDYCQFPELKRLHGAMSIEYENRLNSRMKPIMVLSKFLGDASFQTTPMEAWRNITEQVLSESLPWEDKTDRRIFWRGKSTGGFNLPPTNPRDVQQDWKDSHRIRLHTMVNGLKNDGGNWWFNRKRNVMSPNGKGGFKVEERNDRMLSKAYMDAQLSVGPIQCGDRGLCNYMDEILKFSGFVHPAETRLFRYMLDIDGNGWSSRFHRLLSTGSLVIKFTMFPEWCQSWLIPWYHYVPIKPDYSDLYDVASFFIGPTLANGTVDYSRGHDHLAEKIATNGKHFTMEHWTWYGMQAWNYRLILEIRRLHSLDRKAMSYIAN